ncbi:hypothetical protein KAH37_01455 [bacterium]|nr:hypothetical protein [bacterium]
MRNILYILIIIMIYSSLSGAECSIKTEGLTEGKESHLTILTPPDKTPNRVEIIYSPNSQTSHIQTVPFAPALSLTPHRPGIAKIVVYDAENTILCSRLISIHFNGIPWSGVIIFLLAAITLFTGTFISLRKALKAD